MTSCVAIRDTASKQKQILVVDDDAHMRAAIRACLESQGHQVREAVNGVQALEQVTGSRPALIVLDLTMPAMDGETFVAALRERGLFPGLPILLLSANDDVTQVAERLGVPRSLRKPLRLATLLQTVTQLLAE